MHLAVERPDLLPNLFRLDEGLDFFVREFPAKRGLAMVTRLIDVRGHGQILRLVFGDDDGLFWKFDEFHG